VIESTTVTDQEKEKLRKQLQQDSDFDLERIKTIHGVGSPQGQVANSILVERRHEIRRSARIIARATVVTAIATVAAALAAWTAIWFQYGQTRATPNEFHQFITATPAPDANSR
jgi:hypothetical protein